MESIVLISTPLNRSAFVMLVSSANLVPIHQHRRSPITPELQDLVRLDLTVLVTLLTLNPAHLDVTVTPLISRLRENVNCVNQVIIVIYQASLMSVDFVRRDSSAGLGRAMRDLPMKRTLEVHARWVITVLTEHQYLTNATLVHTTTKEDSTNASCAVKDITVIKQPLIVPSNVQNNVRR